MIISLIAAVDRNFVIGNKGNIPWYLPRDLKRFRELTLGKPIIMGRTTFESIGKALPGRLNIVLTRDLAYRSTSGYVVAHSLSESLRAAGGALEVLIIGGAEVYRQFMPLADRMYLTLVEGEFEGDTHFPHFDWSDWKEVDRESYPADKKNPYPHTFVILERK